MLVIPIILLAFLAVFDYLGLFAAVGTFGTVVTLCVGVALCGLSEGWFLNRYRPRAIRITPEGVDVKKTLGGVRRISWPDMQVSASRVKPFGVLVYSDSSVGFYALSPNQFEALQSSPYRVKRESRTH
jgi:hypothetical protein